LATSACSDSDTGPGMGDDAENLHKGAHNNELLQHCAPAHQLALLLLAATSNHTRLPGLNPCSSLSTCHDIYIYFFILCAASSPAVQVWVVHLQGRGGSQFKVAAAT
jgi:hypothetical protein